MRVYVWYSLEDGDALTTYSSFANVLRHAARWGLDIESVTEIRWRATRNGKPIADVFETLLI